MTVHLAPPCWSAGLPEETLPGSVTALAVHCSDGRFGGPCDRFLRRRLARGADRPAGGAGGAAWLVGHAGLGCESAAAHAALRLLGDAHPLARVVLIAHAGCAFYLHRLGETPGLRGPPVRRPGDRGRWLRALLPGIHVSAYYAQPRESAGCVFRPVFGPAPPPTACIRLRRRPTRPTWATWATWATYPGPPVVHGVSRTPRPRPADAGARSPTIRGTPRRPARETMMQPPTLSPSPPTSRTSTGSSATCASTPAPTTSPQMLTREQSSTFNRDGFLKGLRIFSDGEADANRRYFDDLLARVLAAGGDSYSISTAHLKYGKVYDLLTHPRIVACVKRPAGRGRDRLGLALLLQDAGRRQGGGLAPGRQLLAAVALQGRHGLAGHRRRRPRQRLHALPGRLAPLRPPDLPAQRPRRAQRPQPDHRRRRAVRRRRWTWS